MIENHQITSLKGVFAAVLTPLKSDLSVDNVRLYKHCDWLLNNGCDGLSVLGTTGEANSFSVSERVKLLEALCDFGIPGNCLMPGTGCCSLTDTMELTKHAVRCGINNVLMLPPFYYKGVDDEGLFASYSEIIESVGDSKFKIYLYHFPQMSAVPITYDLIERLLKRYPNTIAGMKDSSGNFKNMARAAQKFPDFGVFSGGDDFLLPLLQSGGVGCITAVCNIACHLLSRIYDTWNNNTKVAEETQQLVVKIRIAAQTYPYSAGLKQVLAHFSGDKNWSFVRPPLVPLDHAQSSDLVNLIEKAGYSPPWCD